MVRCSVGIVGPYFPFFFGADFLAEAAFAEAFLAVLATFLAGAFFAAAFLAGAFFAATFFAGAFLAAVSRFGFALTSSRSAMGDSSWPIAAPSINTTSD